MTLHFGWKTGAAGLMMAALLSLGANLSETTIATVFAPAVKAPPRLDGTLDDACWKDAFSAGKMTRLGRRAGEISENTRFYLCRDNAWLYFGIRAYNKNMPQLIASVRQDNKQACDDDSVEIFFDPGSDGAVYYQFILNFVGAADERKITDRGATRDASWSAPWRRATQRLPDGWTAEIALPLYAMKDGDPAKATFNIGRNEHDVKLDCMGAVAAVEKNGASFSEKAKGFHEPANFVKLDGLTGFAIEEPFAPEIREAGVGGYAIENGKASYPVSIAIAPATAKPGEAVVRISEENAKGEIRTLERRAAIAGTSQTDLVIAVPTIDFMGKKLQVELTTPDGSQICRRKIADCSALELMTPIVTDRNYYTTEKTVILKCRLGMDANLLRGVAARVAIDGEVSREIPPEPAMTVQLPLEAFKPGESTVSIILARGDEKLAERQVVVRRLPPKPGHEIKIDQFNRVILNNGKPFFPFCRASQETISSDDYIFEKMKEVGFNTILRFGILADNHPYRGTIVDAKNWARQAEKHGFMFIDWEMYQPEPLPGKTTAEAIVAQREKYNEKILPALRRVTEIVRESPNLLGYYNIDEPNLLNSEERVAAAERMYDDYRKLDPYRPVNLLYARDIPVGEKWTRYGEALGYDVYTYPGWGGIYNQPGKGVAYFTWDVEQRAKRDGKVAYMVLSSGMLDPGRQPYPLTGEEMLNQVYAAIIQGAKGILYFSFNLAIAPAHWNAMKTAAEQLKTLGPAIVGETVEQKIAYGPGDYDMARQKVPEVTARIFRYPDGRYVMLACNLEAAVVTTRFEIPGLSGARALFEPQTPNVKNDAFEETFAPWAVRAYLLDLTPKEKTPTLTVTIKDVEPKPEFRAPDMNAYVSRLRKNRMPNPTFSQQRLPGFPDFYRPYNCMLANVGETDDWRLDPANPWNGHPSLKMNRELSPRGFHRVQGCMAVCFPKMSEKRQTYAFSFYAKGAKDGDKAIVYLYEFALNDPEARKTNSREFALTRDWKRYEMKAIVDPPPWGAAPRNIVLYAGLGATAWFNGLQLEEGEKTTEFRDDSEIKKTVVPEDKTNLVPNGHAEQGDTRGWKRDMGVEPRITGDSPRAGAYAFQFDSISDISSEKPFALSSDTAYLLAGAFKASGPGAIAYCSLKYYDKDQRPIGERNIAAVANTATTLLKPAAKGETTLTVSDAKNWKSGETFHAAFNADKPLPWFELSPAVVDITKNAEGYSVRLKDPLTASFPVGTAVVQTHGCASSATTLTIKAVPTEWRTFSMTIPASEIKRRQAKYGKISLSIRGDYRSFKNVFVDDLSLRPVVTKN